MSKVTSPAAPRMRCPPPPLWWSHYVASSPNWVVTGSYPPTTSLSVSMITKWSIPCFSVKVRTTSSHLLQIMFVRQPQFSFWNVCFLQYQNTTITRHFPFTSNYELILWFNNYQVVVNTDDFDSITIISATIHMINRMVIVSNPMFLLTNLKWRLHQNTGYWLNSLQTWHPPPLPRLSNSTCPTISHHSDEVPTSRWMKINVKFVSKSSGCDTINILLVYHTLCWWNYTNTGDCDSTHV